VLKTVPSDQCARSFSTDLLATADWPGEPPLLRACPQPSEVRPERQSGTLEARVRMGPEDKPTVTGIKLVTCSTVHERRLRGMSCCARSRSGCLRGSTGRGIATTGVPDRDIPACAECHGPTAMPKNPAYPKLSGQHVRYLTSQLTLLRERRLGGSPHVNLMHVFVDRLRSNEINDVAQYYSALPVSALPPTR
jgi:cytochrome c553